MIAFLSTPSKQGITTQYPFIGQYFEICTCDPKKCENQLFTNSRIEFEWLPASEQNTNFFEVRFYVNAVLSRSLGYFKFGFDSKQTWANESSQVGKKTTTHSVERAREMERLIDGKVICSFVDLARHLKISRARVTQVMNLLKLDPKIYEYLSGLPDIELHRYRERSLQTIASISCSTRQVSEFEKLKKDIDM